MAATEAEEGSYHAIIVKESLRDRSVFSVARILGRSRGRRWTLIRVGVKEQDVGAAIERLQRSLRTVGGIPFYAHLYRGTDLLVIFPGKLFHLTTRRATWAPAIAYGRSAGIPEGELDFFPCRSEDETY